MDWTALSAIGTVLAVVVAWYLGTRRSKAKVYALAPEPQPSGYCRLVVENQSDSPVHVLGARVVWPFGFKLSLHRYTRGAEPWEVVPAEPEWRASVPASLTVEPGKSGIWEFRISPRNRAMRISCIMLFHVDETRWMQISKIRVVKVVQMPATANQNPSLMIIG